MAEELKRILNEAAIRNLAGELRCVHSPFREKPFVAACLKGLADLALMARAWHIADVLHDHLPRPFAAADILLASLGSRPAPDASGPSPLRYMPHLCFVQKYGLDDFEAAMRAQYELTQWFSAEFSIR
ncbi:MAG TPA: hypothetical protein VL101_09615, partial [Nordella sp.]|nr:hypothetical protein [Nordella sp.]